mgnify:CR=1 FL=1
MLWHGPVQRACPFLKALPLNGQEGRREGAVGSVRILECNLNEIERLKEMDITDASAWLHLGWEEREAPTGRIRLFRRKTSAMRFRLSEQQEPLAAAGSFFPALRRSTGSAILP